MKILFTLISFIFLTTASFAVEKKTNFTKEELVKIRNEKFKDKPLPTAEEARTLIERVKLGEDADAVVTEFYIDKENK